MKRIIVAFLLLLAIQAGGFGQESQPSVGIGVGLDPLRIVSVGSQTFSLALTPVVFSMPIVVNDNVRIEPDFGFFSLSREVESSTRSGSFYRLGAGLQFRLARYEDTWLYLGPKVGFFFVSSKSSSQSMYGNQSVETSETDFFISLNIGGEHALSSHFRLFGEVQAYYLSFGDPKTTYSPPSPYPSGPTSYSQSILFTNLILGARFFF